MRFICTDQPRLAPDKVLGYRKDGQPIYPIAGGAITATDIHFRASVISGAAGNATAYAGAGTSLGKYITNADFTDATVNNIFDDVTGDQNAASQVDYQCMFVYNAHGSLTWTLPIAWFSAEVAGGTSAAYVWDTTAASALANASAQALQIANKTTVPSGVGTWQTFTTKGAAAGMSNAPATLPNGQVKALWIRRTAANTVAVDNDGVTVRVEGDTAA